VNGPPGDASCATQFSGFLDEWTSGDEHPPGDPNNVTQTLLFWDSWVFLIGGKCVLNYGCFGKSD